MTQENSKADFSNTAVRGTSFMIGAQIVRNFIVFGSTIIVTRLLHPDDFGLVACLAPVIGFIALLQDAGLQQALIQRARLTFAEENGVFWILAALSVFFAGILWASASSIAAFYGDPRLVPLTVLASVTLVIGGLSAVPMSLLNRHMRFRDIAGIDIAAQALGSASAILGAWAGLSYWALMMMPLVSSLVKVIGALWLGGWRPGPPRFRIDRRMFSFGVNLTGFSLVNFFARNLDNILIGRVWGTVELGLYDRAYKLLMLPLQALNAPLSRVMIPILSRVQDDQDRVRRIYVRAVGVLALGVVPGMAAVTMAAEDVILVLFGEKWLLVAPIFIFLGAASLIQVVGNTVGWIFISQGKTREQLIIGTFNAACIVLAFVVGLPWGAVGVAAAYCIGCYLIILPVSYAYMNRIGPVRWQDYVQIQVPLLIAAALCWGVMTFGVQEAWDFSPVARIGATLVCSYLCAFVVSLANPMGRYLMREVIGLVMRPYRSRLVHHRVMFDVYRRRLFGVRQRPHTLPGELIVSLTSYPPRFPTLLPTLHCLLTQTVRPERVILWVAHDDRAKLPAVIERLESAGLEIRTCSDIRSYKKIVPVLQIFPDAFIVTADDDLYYNSTWLSDMTESWSGNPREIVCHRAHRIRTDECGNVRPYREWDLAIVGPVVGVDVFPTGGGGALYPPKVFSFEVTDRTLFQDLCPTADDIWLYWMARRAGAYYRKTPGGFFMFNWPSSQSVALVDENVVKARNDEQIRAMGAYFEPIEALCAPTGTQD